MRGAATRRAPRPPDLPLAQPAVPVGVGQRADDVLVGQLVPAGLGAVEAFGQPEDLLVPAARSHAALDPSHMRSLLPFAVSPSPGRQDPGRSRAILGTSTGCTATRRRSERRRFGRFFTMRWPACCRPRTNLPLPVRPMRLAAPCIALGRLFPS